MSIVRIPENLNLNELINSQSPENIKGFNKDKVHIVCNSIYDKMLWLDEDKNFCHPKKSEPYFVPLSSKRLKYLIGSDYRSIMTWMQAVGIILIDDSYESEIVSKGYRYTDEFLCAKTRFVTITNYILCKKLKHNSIKKHVSVTPYPNMNKYLKLWINSKELQIDKNEALTVAGFKLQKELTDAKGDLTKIRNAHIKHNNANTTINEFSKLEPNCIFDAFGHRFHTPITRIPKEYRQFVRYNRSGLSQIDISSSQLYMIVYLLNYKNYPTLKKTNPKKNKIWIGTEITRTQIHNTIMFLKKCEKQYGKGLQNHPFCKKVIENGFYEIIVEDLELKGFFQEGMPFEEKRKEVKEKILPILFANPKDKKHAGLFTGKCKFVWNCFSDLFPEIAKLISALKADYYKDICMLLQRIESTAVIKYVCKYLMFNHPQVPIFTLHDCIVTTHENVPLVKSAMENIIGDFIGLKPRLTIEPWEHVKGTVNLE